MREKSPPSMVKWIGTTYEMSPAALARMFQRNARTLNVWLKEGRISPDPHDPRHSEIDVV